MLVQTEKLPMVPEMEPLHDEKTIFYTFCQWPSQCWARPFYSQSDFVRYICRDWQNGTRCRDGVKVLWCRSHLVWLVFEGSIPYMCLFAFWKLFVTFYYTNSQFPASALTMQECNHSHIIALSYCLQYTAIHERMSGCCWWTLLMDVLR